MGTTLADDKSIGVAVATAVGLGAIIGAGIFTLSGTAIALAGGWALFSFFLVGVVAIIVALEIGELASVFPNLSGATYSYVYEAFGSELGFITGIFLYFSFASSISVVAMGFGAYLSSLIHLSPETYAVYFAIAVIAVLAGVNLLGIRKAARADFGLVVVKIAILLVVVAFAFWMAFRTGSATNFFALAPSSQGAAGVFGASVAVFFAYSGFQTISTFVQDVKGGVGAAAKAILASVVVSMVLYVFVAIALMALVPADKFTINADPLAFALSSAHAPAYLLTTVDIGALIATASASLALILTSSRILRQISLDGLIPKAMRVYDEKRDVARNGVLISAVIGIAMLFSGNIFVIAAISNFGLLLSYMMASLALIHYRRHGRTGSFRTPFFPYLPMVGMVAILAFMLGMPHEALVFGVVMVLSLIVAYYTLRELEGKDPVKVRFFD